MIPHGATVDCANPAETIATDHLAQHVSAETLIRRDEPLAKRTTLRVGGRPTSTLSRPPRRTWLRS